MQAAPLRPILGVQLGRLAERARQAQKQREQRSQETLHRRASFEWGRGATGGRDKSGRSTRILIQDDASAKQGLLYAHSCQCQKLATFDKSSKHLARSGASLTWTPLARQACVPLKASVVPGSPPAFAMFRANAARFAPRRRSNRRVVAGETGAWLDTRGCLPGPATSANQEKQERQPTWARPIRRPNGRPPSRS